MSLKHKIDERILANQRLLNNELFSAGYVSLIKQELNASGVPVTASQIRYVGTCISNDISVKGTGQANANFRYNNTNKNMIDDLKAICTNFGLGNASSSIKLLQKCFFINFLTNFI